MACLGGCEAGLPRPLTAADAASYDSADALVAYLAQRDASPAVCDARRSGPHVRRVDGELAAALIRGLADGKVEAARWRACAGAAIESASPDGATALIDAIVDDYRSLASDRALETSPALQARLAALQAVYIQRPWGRDGDPKITKPIFDELRRRFLTGRFGPNAARLVNDLLGVVDLELGRYGGHAVGLPEVRWIAAGGDQLVLRRFSDRLPAADLRAQAQRDLIRLRIAASPFPEVRADAAAIEDRVVVEGVNRVSLAQQPVERAILDARELPARGVLVRQDLAHQTAALFGTAAGGDLSVLPSLSLRGALWVDVVGLSRPITLCGDRRDGDPTPCLGASDLSLENPLAQADRDGTFHFRDKTTEAEAIGLTNHGDAFPLSVDVGGRSAVAFAWPLRFERPADIVLASKSGRGPDLQVLVQHADPALYVFTVSGQGFRTYRTVVEKADLAGYHVVSRGAAGAAGFPGASGTDGTPGMDGGSASCSGSAGTDGTRGGDGTSGGDGGPGGNGSDGGDLFVRLDCGAGACSPEDVALLRRALASEGGAGGPGGSGGAGGRGGPGGSGGSSASCFDQTTNSFTSVSGGMNGSSGSDGSRGRDGPPGAPGRPGRIHFAVGAQPAS
jgi:hypothetical protein